MFAKMDDTEISMRPTVLDCLHGIIDGQVISSATSYIESHRDAPESSEVKAQLDDVRKSLELMRTHREKIV